MTFERVRVAGAAVVLAASSAGAVAALDSPRVLVACALAGVVAAASGWVALARLAHPPQPLPDRKSTRLNSSHSQQSRMPSSA